MESYLWKYFQLQTPILKNTIYSLIYTKILLFDKISSSKNSLRLLPKFTDIKLLIMSLSFLLVSVVLTGYLLDIGKFLLLSFFSWSINYQFYWSFPRNGLVFLVFLCSAVFFVDLYPLITYFSFEGWEFNLFFFICWRLISWLSILTYMHLGSSFPFKEISMFFLPLLLSSRYFVISMLWLIFDIWVI